MPRRDYYDVLGVARDASPEDVKKAYRKLAVQHHPDKNKGDAKSEAKFKEASEAYAVLGEPAERRKYDMTSRAGNFRQYDFGGFESNDDIFSRFGDVFGDLMGGMRGRRGAPGAPGAPGANAHAAAPRQGEDFRHEITIDFMEAVHGAEKTLAVTSGEETRRIRIKVPPGFKSGRTLRIKREGYPGANGGGRGDLRVTVHVRDDARFTLDGKDIVTDVRVPFTTAILGGKILADTPNGAIMLTIPKGTQSGRYLRLAGQGVPSATGAGDLRARVLITVPDALDAETEALVRKLADLADE
jgi:DnaJ-class molecular chaperone